MLNFLYITFSKKDENCLLKFLWSIFKIKSQKDNVSTMNINYDIIKIPFNENEFVNLSDKKREKVYKKIEKFLIKSDINDIIVEDLKLKKIEDELNLMLKNFKIYTGKQVLKIKLKEILNLISKYKNKPLEKLKIGLISNNLKELKDIRIEKYDNIRFVKIFITNNENAEKYIEEVYEEYGLLIEKSSSIKEISINTDIIINLTPFDIKTNSKNILINTNKDKVDKNVKGIIVNNLEIKLKIEGENRDIIDTSKFYEYIYNKIENIEEISYKITGLKGINGKLKPKEFK